MKRYLLLIAVLLLSAFGVRAQESTATDAAWGSVISGFGPQPLYELPDINSTVLTDLYEGTQVWLNGRSADGQWVNVTPQAGTGAPDATGWLWRVTVLTASNIDLLPVIDLTPQAVLTTTRLWNVTPRAFEIYRDGQGRGNRPDFFSKVGDSITVNTGFLYPIGYGVYDLTDQYLHLQPVIEHFRQGEYNAFMAPSNAAESGWTTHDLIAQYAVTSGSCNRGETPLSCEYRVHRPAIALIMIGTNDTGIVPADEYRANLREVVEVTIEHGVIPVLSTIPPLRRNPQPAEQYSTIIIETAAEYRIPLMNYWYVMQSLPDFGLTFDGIHPSTPPVGGATVFTPENLQYGYTARNLLALDMLDLLLGQVILRDEVEP